MQQGTDARSRYAGPLAPDIAAPAGTSHPTPVDLRVRQGVIESHS